MQRWRPGALPLRELGSFLPTPAQPNCGPASARWTTSVRWSSTGPVRVQIEVGPSSAPRAVGWTGERLERQQPLPSAPPLPPTCAAQRISSLPELLGAVRRAHSAAPSARASTILSAIDHQPQQHPSPFFSHTPPPPPIPPPPLRLPTPDPHPASPHALAAFILQAIALGVSAWGLTLGRKKPAPVPCEEALVEVHAREEEPRWKETDEEVFALNLLLSAYTAPALERIPAKWGWPAVSSDLVNLKLLDASGGGAVLPTLSLEGRLAPIAQILKRFDARGVRPDRWTIATVLTTANERSLEGTSNIVEGARPLLARWAWDSFAQLKATEGALQKGDEAIIGGFVRLMGQDGVVGSDWAEEMLDNALDWTTSAPLLLALAKTALDRSQLHLLPALFSTNSTLAPHQRATLALELLSRLALDSDGRRDRELVVCAASALADAAEQSLANEADGTRWTQGKKTLRRAVECLIEGAFKVDVPLEPFVARIAVALIRSDGGVPVPSTPTRDQFGFELSVMRALSRARQPRLTRDVFDAIPSDKLRAHHFVPLLRSHRAETSNRAWAELLAHPSLKAGLEEFSARMSSHRATGDWALAKKDLALMRSRSVWMDRRMANKVLMLVVKFGSQFELARAERALEAQAREKPDTASFTILVCSAVQPVKHKLAQDVSRQAPCYGAAQLGRLRKRLVAVSRREAGRRAHREVDPATGDKFAQVTNEVTKNIILRSVLRWTKETTTRHIVQLVADHLNADLFADPPIDGHVDVSAREWDEWRRARWRMVEKALRNRGEDVVKERVKIWRGAESEGVWRRGYNM